MTNNYTAHVTVDGKTDEARSVKDAFDKAKTISSTNMYASVTITFDNGTKATTSFYYGRAQHTYWEV